MRGLELAHRDPRGPGRVAGGPLVGFTHVEEQGVAHLLRFFGSDLGYIGHRHGVLSGPDTLFAIVAR